MNTGLRPLRHSLDRPTHSSRRARAAAAWTVIWSHLLAAIALLSIIEQAPAGQDASRWDGDARSAIRLIAGSSPATGTGPIRAGIEFRLKAGWHTYWRYPGDAGVPPRFDFTASENVQTVTVRWPAPRRIPEQGLNTIGYEGGVILPLAIVPQDPSKPVILRLKLDYAVCEKLCVPAEGQSQLILSGGPSPHDALLRAAEARVPKRTSTAAGGTLAVSSVRREDGAGGARVIVEVTASRGAAVDVFAEGPTSDWALPVPTPLPNGPPGVKRFAFDLEGAPPGARYRGVPLTVTVVSASDAIELVTHLD
jgi:DsbC/DsbD-like thiol-disulfide interchange protein